MPLLSVSRSDTNSLVDLLLGGNIQTAAIHNVSVSFLASAHLSCRACYGVLRFIMESGAKGCEVVVSGKLRGQRAKSMKFVDGLMIHAGNPIREYIDSAITHVHLRQGMYMYINTHIGCPIVVGDPSNLDF